MKPAPFEFYAPAGVEEALDTLAQLGYGGKLLAGGQSLIPAMNFRLATPAALVDLNNIPELSFIRRGEDGGVVIGAMTRDSQVEFDALVAQTAPMVIEAMPSVAHPQIRNRGTFGGNIAHADPTAQLPAVVIALKGRMHVQKKAAERWVAAEEFFVGPFASVLEPEELLYEVALPPLPARCGTSYKQVARQKGAQALVGVASLVTLDERNRCEEARIALLSVGETPLLANQANSSLIGQEPTREAIRAAAETASTADIDPGGDIHCTAEFRRHLVRVLVQGSLTEAFDRARHSGG